MDLIKLYGYRLLEGIDKNVFVSEKNENINISLSTRYPYDKGVLIKYPDIQKCVKLGCISKYFAPVQRYWKLSDKDSCAKKRRAVGISITSNQDIDCIQCFRHCVIHKCTIMPPCDKKDKNTKDKGDTN